MLDVARDKHPEHKFKLGDMHNLSCILSGIVDSVVIAYLGFSYAEHPEKVVASIQRVLKRSGQVFVMAYGYRCESIRAYEVTDGTGVIILRRYYRADEL